VTSIDDMTLAFDSIKEGAYDYILKSTIPHRLIQAVEQALCRRDAATEKNHRLADVQTLVDCWQPAVVAGEETAEPTPSVEQSVVEAEEAPAAELPTEELVAVPVEIPVETPPPPSIAAPTISVDSMIAYSLGNIFQKKVVKDPIYRALLDRHSNMDMQTLADDLREFSEYIGASEKSETDTQD
jgi:hypothetical protein